MKQNSLKAWVLAARPKTLSGAAVPVFIALALAWRYLKDNDLAEYYSITAAALSLLFALIMQVDANFINDFYDYVRGNDDAETRLGPQRACSQGWVTLHAMKHAIALTTVLACVVGLPLVYFGGLEMIAVGVLCVLFCFLYTTFFASRGLGDVLVLVFFGIVPVCTVFYIETHTVTPSALIASIACGLVTDCLLIVNNYRDRHNDAECGKITLVVRIGERATELLYIIIGVVACLLGAFFWADGMPFAFLFPLLYLTLHLYTWLKMRRINHGRELNQCLGETARNILVYGICVALGCLI